MLTDRDIAELTAFRRELHRFPEVSGQEAQTAQRVRTALQALAPDQIVSGLGGHGVAAVFAGDAPGPVLLFRAELDALPIHEISALPYRSQNDGTAHLCGHDGHSAILLALGRMLSRRRPATGRIVLLFQPAEEDGSGAAAVLQDPGFAALRPDWAFALHNFPAVPLGTCWLAEGPANCASTGVSIRLEGKTSHAAQPEAGLSPGLALARLIPALTAMGRPGKLTDDFRMVTITHARLGQPGFGISPGEAELHATLRSLNDGPMQALKAETHDLVRAEAARAGLRADITLHDDFAACSNDPAATAILAKAARDAELICTKGDLPIRASEDFGRFGTLPGTRAAMLFLGAGHDHPALHNPDYDFPDSLIPVGARLFQNVARRICG